MHDHTHAYMTSCCGFGVSVGMHIPYTRAAVCVMSLRAAVRAAAGWRGRALRVVEGHPTQSAAQSVCHSVAGWPGPGLNDMPVGGRC